MHPKYNSEPSVEVKLKENYPSYIHPKSGYIFKINRLPIQYIRSSMGYNKNISNVNNISVGAIFSFHSMEDKCYFWDRYLY